MWLSYDCRLSGNKTEFRGDYRTVYRQDSEFNVYAGFGYLSSDAEYGYTLCPRWGSGVCFQNMAGGTIVLLGLNLKRGEKLFGTHCASGMHGGKIFVRGLFPKENLSDNIKVTNLDDDDVKELKSYVRKYCKYFGVDFDYVMSKPFKKLVPATSRPYANLYTPN